MSAKSFDNGFTLKLFLVELLYSRLHTKLKENKNAYEREWERVEKKYHIPRKFFLATFQITVSINENIWMVLSKWIKLNENFTSGTQERKK